jgi:catalase
MLQGRLFAYGDAARHRLGVNHHQIPVNAARCPVHSYHRDGALRVDGNSGGTVAYSPNSSGEWEGTPELAEPPLPLQGEAGHWDHSVAADDYSQPGALFRLMDEGERDRLFANTARAIGDATPDVKERRVSNCGRADPKYGAGMARALGLCEPT